MNEINVLATIAISPNYTMSDFKAPWTIENKIDVFEDSIKG